MKKKHQDFIFIKGGTSPNLSDSVDPSSADQPGVPSKASKSVSIGTTRVDDPAQAPWVAVCAEGPPSSDPSFVGSGLEGLRELDSMHLAVHPGVIRVGVNDLGWVVYDWFPGP